MLTVPWGVVVIYVVAWVIFGALVGVLAGLAAAAAFRNGWSGVGLNALIGGIILPTTILFFGFIPWPRNTITYTLRSGTTVTSTMNEFQHTDALGWTLAALLPALREANRYRRRLRR